MEFTEEKAETGALAATPRGLRERERLISKLKDAHKNEGMLELIGSVLVLVASLLVLRFAPIFGKHKQLKIPFVLIVTAAGVFLI